MTTPSPSKIKALFEDLGKPTLRGVRKCPKCGTYNGTRGISCKNKACDVVFKTHDKKKPNSAESVKIITGSSLQVFSVRLRDRGPDYRGFVQLPLVQDMEGHPIGDPISNVDPAILAQAARCYVENCSRNTNVAVPEEPCMHIKAAISCSQEAQPLTLKNSVLNTLNVSNEIKQAIWILATESTGPLVQRVSKNIMVVKCKTNPKQPLGFLHFAFFETSRNRDSPEHKFQCSCRAFKATKPSVQKEDTPRRCVHFYACICAFASDTKLTEEFSYYINLDNSLPDRQQLLTVFSSPPEATVTVGNEDATASMELVVVHPQDDGIHVEIEEEASPTRKRRKDDTLAQASSALLTLQDSGNTPKKSTPGAGKQQANKSTPTPKKVGPALIDETAITITFHHWLGSVTERINQTMHYQFDGSPEPLVFHAPQVFFDCLQQRISSGGRKRRLPNSTTGFVRRDALPLGTFTKYTWHITNILHVKQIFDTPHIPLEVTRSFVENKDGTFDLYEVPKVQVENIDDQFKAKNQTPIRPTELKTYLKVGNMAPGQKDPTAFAIEWIPDILPHSRIGELRIKFEYGHQRNGIIESRIHSAVAEIQTIHLETL